MPPRKSTSSVTPAEDDQSQSQPQSQGPVTATEQQLKARAEGGVSVEDYLLPRSQTLRLAKSVLPPNTAIQKDALLAIQKAATVFVSYLSSHANEATMKRTVAPTDVLDAISELEFEGFRERLEKELEMHTALKGKKKGKKEGTAAAGQEEEENGVRGAKRVKRVSGEAPKESTAEAEGDETQDEPEMLENEEDVVDEEVEEVEEEEEDEDETEEQHEEEDADRVEDLDDESRDRRMMDPDAGDETDTDEEAGPGTQLRSDLGLG